jgi:hypothetical protein
MLNNMSVMSMLNLASDDKIEEAGWHGQRSA